MVLLRIGNITVNMDHVREIYTAPSVEGAVLCFGLDRQLEFAGSEAEALIGWLDSHATNLTPSTEMDEEWEAYKAKGGDMSRPMFESYVIELRELNQQMRAQPDPHKWGNSMDRAARLEEKLLY